MVQLEIGKYDITGILEFLLNVDQSWDLSIH